MVYPKVFKYGADQYSAALDMWFYLLNDVEKSFVIKHGLTKIDYISHQHGVSVGKAFTEYIKSNFRIFQQIPKLQPQKLMYFETLFGFTQGMSSSGFNDDVLFD